MDGLFVIIVIFGIVSSLIKKAKQVQQTPAPGQVRRSPEPEKPWQRMLGDISSTLEGEITGKQPQKVYRPSNTASITAPADLKKPAAPAPSIAPRVETTMFPADYVDTEGTSAPQEPLPKWHGSLAGTEGSVAATANLISASAAPEYAQKQNTAFHLSFTKDSLLQAVVMHEILTRPQDKRRRCVRP